MSVVVCLGKAVLSEEERRRCMGLVVGNSKDRM